MIDESRKTWIKDQRARAALVVFPVLKRCIGWRSVLLPLVILLGAGIVSVVVAIGITRWSPTTIQWAVWSPGSPLTPPIHLDSSPILAHSPGGALMGVREGVGPGYRSYAIQFHPPRDLASTTAPRVGYITEAGWPWPCVTTGSPRIGHRFFANSGIAGTGDVSVAVAGQCGLLWSGLFADMLAIGLPLLALIWLFGLARSKRTQLAAAAAIACGGFWTSIGIAWVVCFLPVERHLKNYNDLAAFGAEAGALELPDADAWDSFIGRVVTSFGYEHLQATFYAGVLPRDGEGRMPAAVRQSLRVGWPLHCLSSNVRPDPHIHQYFAWRVFQMPVSWPGLFGDVMMFSFILVLTAWSVPTARWIYRRRSGACVHCGYSRTSLNPDAPCPECGRRQFGR